MTEGKAFCFGAATIVNGIATGKGASFGIGLRTEARVVLTDDPASFDVRIRNDPAEDPGLARFCVQGVLDRFDLSGKYGAVVETRSNIPISRGLKSSSTAANAVTIATFEALGRPYEDRDIIGIGIDASFRANVTLTGAYDDACASYFGGVVVTDNVRMEVLRMYRIEEDLTVLIHVPERKIRKSTVDPNRLSKVASTIKEAHDLAMAGEYRSAMTINGLTYGSAMDLDTSIAMRAMGAGALAAGISGTGPATVILARPEVSDRLISELGRDQIITTVLNDTKAGPIT